MKTQIHIEKYSHTHTFILHCSLLHILPKSRCNHKSSGSDSDKYNETLGLGGVWGIGEGVFPNFISSSVNAFLQVIYMIRTNDNAIDFSQMKWYE